MISSQAKHGSSVGKAPGRTTSWLFLWIPPNLTKNREAKQLWPACGHLGAEDSWCSHDQQVRFSMHPDRVEEGHPQQMPEVHQSLRLCTDLVIPFLEQLSLFPTPFYLPGSHIEVIIFEKADSETGCGVPWCPHGTLWISALQGLLTCLYPRRAQVLWRQGCISTIVTLHPPPPKQITEWLNDERVAGAMAASFGKRWFVLQFGFLYFYGCARLWGKPGKFRV